MLAQKPPMGWNSWNTFGWSINEQVVRDTADQIVELGLKDCGYEYVVIDDCWSLRKRDGNGKLVADPKKFPSGMKALADYVHSKGLKFGMYSCAGTKTCAGFPGSFDYEFVDAQTFADWGVDFLKYDYCSKPNLANGPFLYNRMSMALKATGREILFSACNWGCDEAEKWIRSMGAHMYRSTGDIYDSYERVKEIAMSQVDKLGYSAPGCYNDIDMLICGMRGVGNVGQKDGCTDAQYRTHFALWCLFQSPLMIGGNLSAMNEFDLNLLKNKELLAINQDEEARPPIMVTGGNRPVFFKHLSGGEFAIAFVNFTDKACTPRIEFYDIGLTVASGYGFRLRDVFSGEEVGLVKEEFSADCSAYGCRIYRGYLAK